MSTNLSRWILALSLVLCSTATSFAGWQTTYELTCFRKRCNSYYQPPPSYYVAPPVTASYYAPNCNSCSNYVPPVTSCYAPPPPPTQVCTTNYVQRTHYEPYTAMQQQTYYEPVTRYETKWGYEPVTSYRSSYAFDPCHRSCYPVYTQSTSYYARPYTTPVTNFIARSTMVPVTAYRQYTSYEPQTSCQSCPNTASNPPAVSSGAVISNWQPANPGYPPAGVTEDRKAGVVAPGVNESSRYATPGSYRPAPAEQKQPIAPRLDRITKSDGERTPVRATLAKRVIED